MRLNQKLMLAFMITALLPMILLSNYFYNQIERVFNNSVSESYQKVVYQTTNTIQYNIRFYESIIDSLVISDAIQSVLANSAQYDRFDIIRMNDEIKNAIKYIKAYQSTDVQSIEFYSTLPNVISDGSLLFPYERLEAAYRFDERPQTRRWMLDQVQGRYYYTLLAPIHSISAFDNIGYIKLTIRIPAITNVDDSPLLGQGSQLLIADDDGDIIYSTMVDRMGGKLNEELISYMAQTEEDNARLTLTMEDSDYNIWYYKLNNVDWTAYLIAPKKLVERELSALQRTNLIIVCIFAIVFILITFMITRRLTNSLRKLYNKVSNVSRGLLFSEERKAAAGRRGDEVTELHRNFDQMVSNLNELIHENYIQKLARREMELNLLQAQINPHFLYNTLDTIKNEIDLDERDNAMKMVVALANLFRTSVSGGRNIITWADEILHAQSYLEIHHIRFGHSIRFEWQIDERLYALRTLKMVLQPLLENAIQHAFTEQRGEAIVRIVGELTSDTVVIAVSDNGKGMNSDRIREIYEQGGTKAGIGLINIHERIRMYFGEEYGLQITSESRLGTTITLVLPILESEDHV